MGEIGKSSFGEFTFWSNGSLSLSFVLAASLFSSSSFVLQRFDPPRRRLTVTKGDSSVTAILSLSLLLVVVDGKAGDA